MKKVLALVLAVMMLAVTAFAAADVVDPDQGLTAGNTAGFMPGEKIKITAEDIIDATKDKTGTDKYVRDSGTTTSLIKDLNSSNYSITGVKYDEGKSMVESVKFNDKEDRVEIKIKQDFDMTKGKTLKMNFDLKGKKVGKTKPDSIHIVINRTINYGLNKNKDNTNIVINGDDDVDIPSVSLTDKPLPAGGFNEEWVYKVQVADGSEYDYGTLEFTTADDEVEVEVRVYKDDELYLYNDTDADDDVLKAYADTDADLTFLTFKGKPTFNATATVRFYKEEGTYIYANNDGKLSRITAASAGSAGQTAGNVKWDEDEGCYILKTRTLGSYVFSDKALNVSASAGDPATTNPDTGANDVVGIASALAAVALVSAAAVSLKK